MSVYERLNEMNDSYRLSACVCVHVLIDLTPHFPFEAKSINQKSLAELNAYIDHLDRRPSRPPSLSPLPHVEPPVVTRTLSFFKAFRTRRGRLLPGRVQQFRVVLPTIPPGASVIDRDHIAAVYVSGCAKER